MRGHASAGPIVDVQIVRLNYDPVPQPNRIVTCLRRGDAFTLVAWNVSDDVQTITRTAEANVGNAKNLAFASLSQIGLVNDPGRTD